MNISLVRRLKLTAFSCLSSKASGGGSGSAVVDNDGAGVVAF